MRSRLLGATVAVLLALVGTAAVVVYVQGIETRALAGERTVAVLVVDQVVAAGTPAEELTSAVTSQQVPVKIAADGSVASLEQLTGQVTTVALEPGEQVLAGRFATPAELAVQGQVDVPSDLQQVTVALEPQRAVGGRLSPGDTVGVFISLTDGDDDAGGTTHLALHKVLVTHVHGRRGPDGADTAPGEDGLDHPDSLDAPTGNVLVTLAASASEAERIVFAAEHGRVWLSNEPSGTSETGTGVQSKETIYR